MVNRSLVGRIDDKNEGSKLTRQFTAEDTLAKHLLITKNNEANTVKNSQVQIGSNLIASASSKDNVVPECVNKAEHIASSATSSAAGNDEADEFKSEKLSSELDDEMKSAINSATKETLKQMERISVLDLEH